jgi:riboflavin kinase / FMN adenylyltransferase
LNVFEIRCKSRFFCLFSNKNFAYFFCIHSFLYAFTNKQSRESTKFALNLQDVLVRIHDNITQLPAINHPIITVGTFDGVHIGHQRIIQRINQLAQEVNGESVLLTFNPHPRIVLFPEDENIKLITTTDEKNNTLAQFGLQHVIHLPFEKTFSRLSAQEYVRDFLVNHIGLHTIVIGYDHRFGRNRQGDLNLLKELSPVYGFNVEEIAAQTIDDINVSSTKIRHAIQAGDMEQANEFLGHPFVINGTVVKGEQIGRTIGFPTANVYIGDQYKILPKNGVYRVKVVLKNIVYSGIMNIGVKPTLLGNVQRPTTEVHLFEFNEDIYGAHLTILPEQFIREEQKFDSLHLLKAQIQQDILAVQKVF